MRKTPQTTNKAVVKKAPAVIEKNRKRYALEQTGPNIHTFRFTDIKIGWEQWFLFTGDRHHDNVQCDQAAEKRHLKVAEEREAIIVDVGDLFDAMQGKGDKRSDKAALRAEHKVTNYLDSLVNTAADFYGPYANLFAVLGRGNHESSVMDKHGVDLTDLLAYKLRTDYGGDCYAGGFGGWLRLLFTAQRTVRTQRLVKYFHGAGGGGPVTRGVIQTNRQAVYLPDADVVVNGHTHDSYCLPIARERLTRDGAIVRDLVWYLRTTTYKDEYGTGAGGWHVERGAPPKPIGCIWGKFCFQDDAISAVFTQDVS